MSTENSCEIWPKAKDFACFALWVNKGCCMDGKITLNLFFSAKFFVQVTVCFCPSYFNVRHAKSHLHYAQFLVLYGKIGTDEIFNRPIASQISSAPNLSDYTMVNFRFGKDKIEIDEIWIIHWNFNDNATNYASGIC